MVSPPAIPPISSTFPISSLCTPFKSVIWKQRGTPAREAMKLTAEPHLSLWFYQSKSPSSSFAAPPHTQLVSGGSQGSFPPKLPFILFAWSKPPTQVGTSCNHISLSCQRSKQANCRPSPFFLILQTQSPLSSPALLGNTCCSPPYPFSALAAVDPKYLPLLIFIPK